MRAASTTSATSSQAMGEPSMAEQPPVSLPEPFPLSPPVPGGVVPASGVLTPASGVVLPASGASTPASAWGVTVHRVDAPGRA
jgi:hypothetical protein